MKKVLFLVVLAALSLPVVAAAQVPVPMLSMKRLAIAGGANYDWYSESNLPPYPKEFSVGLYAAYALTAPAELAQRTPRTCLIAALERGFDNRTLHTKVGLRVTLWDGNK